MIPTINLSEKDRESYTKKYNLMLKKKIPLKPQVLREMFESQFSVNKEDSQYIIDKAYDHISNVVELLLNQQESLDTLNQYGFFLCLKYIQCQQNNLNIREINDIHGLLLDKRLIVIKKDKNVSQPKEVQNGNNEPSISLVISDVVDGDVQEPLDSGNNLEISQRQLANIQELQFQFGLVNQSSFKSSNNNQQLTYSDILPVVQVNSSTIKQTTEQYDLKDKLTYSKILPRVQNEIQDQMIIDLDDQIPTPSGEPSQESESQQTPYPSHYKNLNNLEKNQEQEQMIGQEQDQIHDQKQEQLQEQKQVQKQDTHTIIDDDDEEFEIMDRPSYKSITINQFKNDQFSSDIDSPYKQISVKQFEYHKEGLLEGYQRCKISTKLREAIDNQAVKVDEVDRRYSDFEKLNYYIRRAYKTTIFPLLPEKETIYQFINNKFQDGSLYLEQRRQNLENYLKLLIKEPKIQNDIILRRFLTDGQKFETILQDIKLDQNMVQDLLANLDVDSIDDLFPQILNIQEKTIRFVETSISDVYIFGFFSKNKEINATFQDDFRRTKNFQSALHVRYSELKAFQLSVEGFYHKIEFIQDIQMKSSKPLIVDQKFIEQGRRSIQKYENCFAKEQETKKQIFVKIEELKQSLLSVFSYYNFLEQDICTWDRKRQRSQDSSLSQIQLDNDRLKIAKESETLTRIITELNKSLDQICQDYGNHIKALLQLFNQTIIVTMKELYTQ